MGSPGRYAAAIGLAFAAGLSAGGAQALDVPPVGGIGAPGERVRPFSIFVGGFAGTDSNILRDPASVGEVPRDTFTELLGGMALVLGGEDRKFDLHCQIRADRFGELAEHDFEESEFLLGVQLAGERVRLGLRSRYALLVEPTDTLPEITGHLDRRHIDCAADVDVTLGPMELAVGYAGRFVDYNAAKFRGLDLRDNALRTELRWRRQAAEPQEVFVHLDLGKADYEDVSRSDFGYRRTYLGWRQEAPHRSGIELGAGWDAVDDFGVGELFGLVRFRSGLSLRGGRSAVELAYVRGVEAAATADCRMVSRMQVRYSEAPRPHLGWSIGLSAGKAEYVNPASPLPSSPWYSLDAGLQIEIGPPKGAHGRLYATASYESGELPDDDYYRWRALAGLAFVY